MYMENFLEGRRAGEAGKCKYIMNKDFTPKNPSSYQYLHLPASLTNCKELVAL